MKVTRAINSPLEFEIPDPRFKMTVDTTQPGSASDTFVLPLQNGTTNMTVYWGDGSSDVITTYNQAELTHVYTSSGTYQISLEGSFHGIRFLNSVDKLKLSSIDNWGTNEWLNMEYAFAGCTNMVGNYTDNPNTSMATRMHSVFQQCTNFNSDVVFDASGVTSSSGLNNMFYDCTSFNSKVSLGDTSAIQAMQQMFWKCTNFNQPIDFDTSSVTKTGQMFYQCTNFNQSIDFNLPLVTRMDAMFFECTNFNSPVNITNTALCTNFGAMFQSCINFNQSVSSFNTSAAVNMIYMFWQCTNFDQDISGFDISNLNNIDLNNSALQIVQDTSFSQANYDLALVAWNDYGTSDVKFYTQPCQYSAGAPATARADMISRGWIIIDGGQA
jgi:hypothetical protein